MVERVSRPDGQYPMNDLINYYKGKSNDDVLNGLIKTYEQVDQSKREGLAAHIMARAKVLALSQCFQAFASFLKTRENMHFFILSFLIIFDYSYANVIKK